MEREADIRSQMELCTYASGCLIAMLGVDTGIDSPMERL